LKLISLCLFLFLSVFVPSSAAQSGAPEEPEANPGRPTVATPATITPVGYLQFETGFLGANHSPEFSSRYSLNEVVKLSVTSRLEFLVPMEPVVHCTANGITGNSGGDLYLGAQAVLYHGEGARPTLAASYFYHVYDDGAPSLDIGSPTNIVELLASADVKGFHFDVNAFFTELVQGPVRRAQYGQTISISHPITQKFALTGELWQFTQPYLQSNAVGNLWAVSYTARKTLVFDAGFNRGLTGTSTRWEVFAGFTYLLPHRLWKVH
jgi:hypothetical protein